VLDVMRGIGAILEHSVGMPYKGYGARAQLAHSSGWYSVAKISEALMDMETKDFSKVVQRKSMRDTLAGLENKPPFSEFARFVDKEQFVFRNYGDWNNKFMSIYAALDYSGNEDRGNANPPAGDQQRQPRNAPQSNSFGYDDASTAFRNAVASMLKQIRSSEGVVDRARFESEYGLKWVVSNVLDIFPAIQATLKTSEMLYNPTDVGSWDFPGLARARLLSAADADVLIEPGTQVVLFSTAHSGGRRSRTIFMLQNDHTPMAVRHDLVETTD